MYHQKCLEELGYLANEIDATNTKRLMQQKSGLVLPAQALGLAENSRQGENVEVLWVSFWKPEELAGICTIF
eukprot:1161004-Pelagomonas_calceolata.AAC.3